MKLTVFTCYEIVTRDLHFREEFELGELEVADVLDLEEDEEWGPHPDVVRLILFTCPPCK